MSRRIAVLLAVALAALGCAGPVEAPPPPPPVLAPPSPPTPVPLPAPPVAPGPATSTDPAGPTAGYNDFACRPAADHPRPVVLVHGGLTNMERSWGVLAPKLVDAGYCVFALDYGAVPESPATGIFGAAPMPESAAQLDGFIDQVLAATGASEVDIVGHSRGGVVPRFVIKFRGGADRIATLVGLAPANHGGDLSRLTGGRALPPEVIARCPGCVDLVAGSPLLQQLNGGGDTAPGVSYTVIATEQDNLVTPISSAFLDGPDVTNLTVQQLCPGRPVGHGGVLFDPVVHTLVLGALDPAAAAEPDCDEPAPRG